MNNLLDTWPDVQFGDTSIGQLAGKSPPLKPHNCRDVLRAWPEIRSRIENRFRDRNRKRDRGTNIQDAGAKCSRIFSTSKSVIFLRRITLDKSTIHRCPVNRDFVIGIGRFDVNGYTYCTRHEVSRQHGSLIIVTYQFWS